MAIDDDLPSLKQPSVVFTSSCSSSASSSLSPFIRQRRLIQVATDNSATFIRFPTNAHQSSLFVPISRPIISHSSRRQSSPSVDTQSLSNQSKSSIHAATSSITSGDHKPDHSQQRINPILINPLLNHRKEQPKCPPIKISNEQSSKLLSNNTQITTNRASTVPPIVHQQEININLSDRLIISINNKTSQQQMKHVDENKYDYINRWLNEVRTATFSNEICRSEPKRTKRRVLPS
ncbi:unnamed protein product [Rotaria sp. Silwood2]|nr:unnamed protein product [Rotaria sp. Silwood2]CAF3103003.1 unnamed protein product [Rotaria sp. Silwood2]CAF3200371.1 unnamed protein product [Rotaria sp. Silwood2]CAF3223600.1 unnamed protein product [Rotaria sp. Silwood2]CAF4136959.1 unnamed protein product [Rotaria sp. Silwood2]